jgi:hypothetical protein
MVIRTSIFYFLRIEHLTWVGDFSPSVDSGASVDHYNVLKSYFRVSNLIVKFNVLSKSGFIIEVSHFCAEISLLSHRKTRKIATFRKNRKMFNSFSVKVSRFIAFSQSQDSN